MTGLTLLLLLFPTRPVTAEPRDLVIAVEDTKEANRRDPEGDRWRAVDVAHQLLGPQDKLSIVRYGDRAEVQKEPDVPEGRFSRRKRQRSMGAIAKPAAGIHRSLDVLKAHGRENARPEIIVLSAGERGESNNEELKQVVDRVRKDAVLVHAIHPKHSSVAGFLRDVSKAAGGNPEEVKKSSAFPMLIQSFFDRLRPDFGAPLKDGRMPVDENIDQVRFVARTLNPEGVVVVDPRGKRHTRRKHGDGLSWSEDIAGASINVKQPAVGTWRVDPGRHGDVRVFVTSDLILRASVPAEAVAASSRVHIKAHISRDGVKLRPQQFPDGLNVTMRRSGMLSPVRLTDDGQPPDKTSGDGVFTGFIEAPPSAGVHEITLKASAPGFFRRAVAPLLVEVTVKKAKPKSDAVKEALVAARARKKKKPKKEQEAGTPPWLLLAAATGLLLPLLLLARRRKKEAEKIETARANRADSEPHADAPSATEDQAALTTLVADHFTELGHPIPELPSDPPPGMPFVLLLDAEGSFEPRMERAVGDHVRYTRVIDVRAARRHIRDERPALLIAVDPLRGATPTALLRWLASQGESQTVPVIRVVQTVQAKTIRRELKEGVQDFVSIHSDGSDLLRRIARSLKFHQLITKATPSQETAEDDGPLGASTDWISQRMEDVPVEISVFLDGWGEKPWTAMLVDVTPDGLSLVAPQSPKKGSTYELSSELFSSLGLGKINAHVHYSRNLSSPKEFPFLWVLRHRGLDTAHQKRIHSCYQQMVDGRQPT